MMVDPPSPRKETTPRGGGLGVRLRSRKVSNPARLRLLPAWFDSPDKLGEPREPSLSPLFSEARISRKALFLKPSWETNVPRGQHGPVGSGGRTRHTRLCVSSGWARVLGCFDCSGMCPWGSRFLPRASSGSSPNRAASLRAPAEKVRVMARAGGMIWLGAKWVCLGIHTGQHRLHRFWDGSPHLPQQDAPKCRRKGLFRERDASSTSRVRGKEA